MSKKGIDVSKWQGDIDWQKVKESGVEFAIIREGYGKESPTQVDKKFEQNYQGAKSAGIGVGVYHYSYADSVEDAVKEAEFCLKNIKGKQLEYPVVFDIEDKEQLKLNNRQRTDIVKAFCQTIENAGYYVMIYCNLNWWNTYLYKDELARYDLWLAQWGVDAPSVSCGIWQYSESGKVNGISGNVDLDIAYKDYPMLMKIKGCNGFNAISGGEYKAPEDTKEQPVNQTVNYVVKKGDTLSKIAKEFGVSVSDLAAKNNIKDVNKIYVGQVLVINGDSICYTVESGDTLIKIADKFKVSYQDIAKLNGMENPNLIYVGQKLRIK